jgi:glucosamine--fructose-6-phosphate aminotransferase (isomerizing)
MADSYTLDEIYSQPEIWTKTLDDFELADLTSSWRQWDHPRVVVVGCGSTHYLAMSAAALLRSVAGIEASAFPASELVLNPAQTLVDVESTVLLAISRSGTTSETVAAIAEFKSRGGRGTITITCDSTSPLAIESDVVLAADAAQERSIAQTRSFSSMFILAASTAAALAGRDIAAMQDLPTICHSLLRSQHAPMTELAGRAELDRFFFLGSGVHYGLASEAMLKMKEMSLTGSEAYHFLEFRHGPMSMIQASAAVIGLIDSDRLGAEQAVLDEMAGLGAVVRDASYRSAMPSWQRAILALPSLQLLAYERSIAKGLDPDRPRHLAAVVELDAI